MYPMIFPNSLSPVEKRQDFVNSLPLLSKPCYHPEFSTALKVLKIVNRELWNLRTWEKSQGFSPREVNIFLDVDNTIIEHGSDLSHRGIRFLGSKGKWRLALESLKHLGSVNIYALTALGITSDKVPLFNSLTRARSNAFSREGFPFTRKMNPLFNHNPIQSASENHPPIEIYNNGMFFVPTLVNQRGHVDSNPRQEEKELDRSKGQLLFKHIYDSSNVRTERNIEFHQRPCFIFIDDRDYNCKSVFFEGQQALLPVHTFQIAKK